MSSSIEATTGPCRHNQGKARQKHLSIHNSNPIEYDRAGRFDVCGIHPTLLDQLFADEEVFSSRALAIHVDVVPIARRPCHHGLN